MWTEHGLPDRDHWPVRRKESVKPDFLWAMLLRNSKFLHGPQWPRQGQSQRRSLARLIWTPHCSSSWPYYLIFIPSFALKANPATFASFQVWLPSLPQEPSARHGLILIFSWKCHISWLPCLNLTVLSKQIDTVPKWGDHLNYGLNWVTLRSEMKHY